MGKRVIVVTRKEYDSYINELEKLQKMYQDTLNKAQKVIKLDNDVYHDVHENSQTGVALLRMEIDKIKEKIESFEITNVPKDENAISFDDTVLLKFLDDDSEEEFKLVQRCSSKNKFSEISLGSPIGEAIYGAKVGDTVTYSVGSQRFEVKILEKL